MLQGTSAARGVLQGECCKGLVLPGECRKGLVLPRRRGVELRLPMMVTFSGAALGVRMKQRVGGCACLPLTRALLCPRATASLLPHRSGAACALRPQLQPREPQLWRAPTNCSGSANLPVCVCACPVLQPSHLECICAGLGAFKPPWVPPWVHSSRLGCRLGYGSAAWLRAGQLERTLPATPSL